MVKEIDILVVEPGKAPQQARTQNTVEAFEKIVGGPIDVGCFMPEKVLMISNANAAAEGLAPNRANPRGGEYLFGTFLLCGVEEDFTSLTAAQIAFFRTYFKNPGELTMIGSESVVSALLRVAAAAQGFLEKLETGEAALVDKSGRKVVLDTGRNVSLKTGGIRL